MRAPFRDDTAFDESLAEWLLDQATMLDSVAKQIEPSVLAKLTLARAVHEILGQLVA